MKKRILSIVLAVLMLVSVMPISAMAATTDTPQTDTGAARQMSVSANSEDKAVHVTKSVSEDGKTLTLEAYATNTMTTVTTYEPLDIVLVLDVSGSMDDPMGSGDNTKRIDALKTAVKTFIDNVAKQKNGEKTVDHRISIVKFSGMKTDKPGNDTYRSGGYTYNYSQIVKSLTAVSKNGDVDEEKVAELKNAVQNLNPAGSTRSDNGMELARDVLNERKDEAAKRNSVVVLFTDGKPTSGSNWDNSVASGAISAAKAMKAGGTKIYTVGIFDGVNPDAPVTGPGSDRTSAENKYMHAMSSNYPQATYTSNYWSDYSFNFGAPAAGSYYLAALSAEALKSVFQTISGEIGSLKAKVDASSVLSDTLSDMFDFNGSVAGGIEVKKVPVAGKDVNGNYTWGTPEDATGVTVSVDTKNPKKLNVTGFDYAENAVTANTDGSYKGYKLVVTIPIKPDTEYHGWADGEHYYDTNSIANDSKAGLEYGETGSRQKLELNESPEAPVTGYTVSYQFKGTAPDGVTKPDDKVYIEGQNYTIETAPSKEGWTFTGWCSDRNCTIAVSGRPTMGTGPVTYYGKWEQKVPNVIVVKTATYSRDGKDMGFLPNNTNDLDKIGRVQVDDVIDYTVTITNKGDVTFGYNINDYRAIDTFSNATGNLIQIDEDGKQIGTVESDKQPPNIILGDMKPGDTKTLYYRYTVLSGDVGKEINNSATAEIKSGTESGKISRSSNVRVYVEQPEPETVNVSYRYEAESGTLPEGLETAFPLPEQTTVNKGSNITISKDAAKTGSEYPVDGGKWVLWSWIADNSITGVQQDVTFTGTWKFVADEPKTTTITVKKEWGTGVTDEQKLPVVVRLLDHGVAKWIEKDITLDGDNKWIGTFTVDYDAEAKYSVIEAKIGTEWFYNGTATIDDTTWEYAVEGDKDTGFTITNSIKKDEQPEPPTGTFKVDYVYKTLDGVTLPDDALAAIAKTEYKLPDEMTVDAGETVYAPTTPTEGDKVTVDDGEWEFVRWDTEYIENISEGATFTGYWKFTAKEPEPEDHEFTAHIVKRFENKSGKSPKATFTFIAELEDGTEVGRETISFSKGDVDAGKIGRDDVTMTVTLTDTQYKELERDEYGPYLWIYEEDGEVDGVKYDTKPQKAYIYEKPVAWSLEFDEDGELVLSVPDETKLYCLVGDETVEDFVFTNVYKKPGEKGETIKSGPQLNRDDHVAYIMGYPDGTVQPEGEITRAEACTIFFRLLTESSRDYYFARTNDYSDVNRGDWFNNAISTLSNAGIVTGYNDGTFRPNQPITRGEMAKIIANFANLKYGGKTFTDLAGHWSKSYVELAAGNGWIAGYPDGSFRPDQKITRAETVTMINRVLDRVPAKESRLLSRSIMLTFPDNKPGDWYYIAIQEASNSHEYRRSVYETTGDEMWTKLIDNVDWTKLEK